MTDSHIIIAGQSNALGFGNTGAAPYVPTARVQIWADTNGDGQGDAWNYMRPGANTGTLGAPGVWGPEVQIANDWLADHATGNLWIVKDARGSTGLAQDAGAVDWSPHSTGEAYDHATASVQAARANLVGSQYAFDHYDALMWMQGETDATDAVKAANYGANFADLLQHVRFDWGVAEVVAGRISDSAALVYNADVRVAVWAADPLDDHLATFRTIEFGRQADGIHLDAAGQVSLGHAFYDGWF